MAAIIIELFGEVVAKGRARFAHKGNFTTVYTPEHTVAYETNLKLAAHQAMNGRPMLKGPVFSGAG